ncbi:hypothetical protein [Mumia zhuanghuii]|uniref:hypothetical protein n=1 Tax=Mumia zhuanghuii TaxID=2585211 RepID=UPI00129CF2FC|nr:hypothetical protein [Mumia zhuanghuii]
MHGRRELTQQLHHGPPPDDALPRAMERDDRGDVRQDQRRPQCHDRPARARPKRATSQEHHRHDDGQRQYGLERTPRPPAEVGQSMGRLTLVRALRQRLSLRSPLEDHEGKSRKARGRTLLPAHHELGRPAMKGALWQHLLLEHQSPRQQRPLLLARARHRSRDRLLLGRRRDARLP